MSAGSGKARAQLPELLAEGLRLAKAGLPDKALVLYEQVRRSAKNAAVVAEAHRLEAYAQQACGRWQEALTAAQASAALARDLEQDDLLAEALNAEAAVHYARGAFDKAMPLFERMLELTTEPRIRGLALQNLGIIHGRRGELDAADRRLTEAYEAFEEAGYEWGQAHVLNNRVGLALERGDYEVGEAMAHRALAVARRVDDMDLAAVVMLNHAEILAELDELERAEEEVSTALGYFESAGNHWRRVGCYQLLGDLNQKRGDGDVARRLWRQGLALARELDVAADVATLEERLSSSTP